MKKKVLHPESMPEFDEGIKNMSDYSRGRVDVIFEMINRDEGPYLLMDTYCQKSLEPKIYEKWLEVLQGLALSDIRAKEYIDRMGYNNENTLSQVNPSSQTQTE